MASIEPLWRNLLKKCYFDGTDVTKDDNNIRELMGNYYFLERPQDISFPIPLKVDHPDRFLELMKSGLYNIQGYPLKDSALVTYVTSLHNSNEIYCSDSRMRETLHCTGDPFIYSYPERLLHYLTPMEMDKEEPKVSWIDQIDTIIQRLKTHKGSNRAVATLYNPGVDSKRDDIPCLNWLQATVRDGKLALHVMFRSNDLFYAWPSNILFLTYLGLNISREIYARFYGIYYHSSSLHIYERDLDTVKEILE